MFIKKIEVRSGLQFHPGIASTMIDVTPALPSKNVTEEGVRAGELAALKYSFAGDKRRT
jgi:hypothetical protein